MCVYGCVGAPIEAMWICRYRHVCIIVCHVVYIYVYISIRKNQFTVGQGLRMTWGRKKILKEK